MSRGDRPENDPKGPWGHVLFWGFMLATGLLAAVIVLGLGVGF